MKNILQNAFRLSGIIILIMTFLTTANAQWVWQNPLPSGNNIRDLQFLDANTVIGIGFTGTVIRSTDGGENWTLITLSTTKSLYSMYFLNSTTGFATGNYGSLFKTTDGGNTWTESTIGGSILYSIRFYDNNNGLICGASGRVMRTTNGGSSWTTITTGLTGNLYSLSYGDANNVFICGASGKILASSNGGENWSEQISNLTSDLNAIDFANSTNGIAVGSTGKIIKTTNGGAQWDGCNPGATSHFMGTYFIDSNNGVAAGQNIVRTTDGGTSWSVALSNVGTTYLRSVVINNSVGIAAGDYGMIYRTTNSGANWVQVFKAASKTSIRSADFIDSNTGIAVCEGGNMIKTTNGGVEWTAMISPTIINLFGIDIVNDTLFYISGQTYPGQPASIYKTTDAGATWNPLTGTTGYTTSIAFFNTERGITGGTNIFTTRNGGATWEQSVNPTGKFVNSIKILNDSVVIAVGNTGSILRSGDMGLTWSEITSGTTQNLVSVDFSNELKGIAVGGAGNVLITTDGGLTWSALTPLTTYPLNAVTYRDENTWYTGGTNGLLWKSTDGGSTWVSEATGTSNPLYAIKFVNPYRGFIFGHYGTILNLDEPVGINAPSNLTAVADTHFVTLNWSDNSNNESGFKVERKDDSLHLPGDWTYVGTVNENTTSYTDTGLTPLTTYCYRIYAYNDFGNSMMSNPVQTTTIIPVELISFKASVSGKGIKLSWSTATEINNKGFEVERKTSKSWETVGFVSGKGTTTEKNEYSFYDIPENAFSGMVSYRLKQIDFNGSYNYSFTINIEADFIPEEYSLDQNYPNPFNPSTRIKYALPFISNVKVEVFNMLGESISVLANSIQTAGTYELDWNAAGNASGIYFYGIEAKSVDSKNVFRSVKKMILIR